LKKSTYNKKLISFKDNQLFTFQFLKKNDSKMRY
jgi:hypothetical protein